MLKDFTIKILHSQRKTVVEFNSKHGISTYGRGECLHVCGSDPFGFCFLDKTEKVMSSWRGLKLSDEAITKDQLDTLYGHNGGIMQKLTCVNWRSSIYNYSFHLPVR